MVIVEQTDYFLLHQRKYTNILEEHVVYKNASMLSSVEINEPAALEIMRH